MIREQPLFRAFDGHFYDVEPVGVMGQEDALAVDAGYGFRRSFPGSGRLQRRIVSTLDAFSPRSYNVATQPVLLPPVIML